MMRSQLRMGASTAAMAAVLSVSAGVGLVVGQSPTTTGPDLSGVVLKVWDLTAPSPAKQAVNDAFTAKTGATFDWQSFPMPFETTILTKFNGGDHPDILWFHSQDNWFRQLNPEQNLRDVTGEAYLEKYAPGQGGGAELNGKKYGTIIKEPDTYGLVYNKEVIAAAGLTVPTTFADLLQFCTDLKAKLPGVAPVFMGGGDQWPLQVPTFHWVLDDQVADPAFVDNINANTTTFSDPRFVDTIAKTKQLQDAGCFNDDVLTATYADMQTAIMEGTAALEFAGSWYGPDLVAAYGIDKVNELIEAAPIGEDKGYVAYVTPDLNGTFFLPKTGDAAREAAALEYARFLMGDGYKTYIEIQGGIPVLEGYEPSANTTTMQKHFSQLLGEAGVPMLLGKVAAPYGAFEVMMSELFAGTKTSEEVAAQLTTEFQRAAQNLGLPGF